MQPTLSPVAGSIATRAPRAARELFGEPALVRRPDGSVTPSESAKRALDEAAVREGRLVRLSDLALLLEVRPEDLWAAVRGGGLAVRPGRIRGASYTTAEEAIRFAATLAEPVAP